MGNIDKAADELLVIIKDKEMDVETRAWAREEMSKILKLIRAPPIVMNMTESPGPIKYL